MEIEKNNFKDRGKFEPRMSPNIPGKLNYGRTFLIGLAFMTSSIAWSYYNFMMPLILKVYLVDLGVTKQLNTVIGIIMVLDNIVAILMLPYFGALSDKTKSKYGRRIPFIFIGCIGAVISFSLIGMVSNFIGMAAFVGLISVIMLFNFSMAFYRSSSVSLMPDLTDPEVRSTGNAIINLMGAVSMVIGLAIPIITDLAFEGSRSIGFYLVSIITTIALTLLLMTIKETPTGEKFMEFSENSIAIDPVTYEYLGEHKTEVKESSLEGLKTLFKEEEKSGLYMLLTIFFFFFGYNAIDTFYSLYATEYMGWEEGSASALLMLAPGLMILTAIATGKMGDIIGRKKTILIGLIGLSFTMFVMYFLNDKISIGICMGVVGVFFGMININTIVVMWSLAPKGKIGAYTGAYYLFSMASTIISPVFAGVFFDLWRIIFNLEAGQEYIVMFGYVIFFELIAMFTLSRVKRGESKKVTENQL